MGKILPILLALLGTGAGVGAGIVLMPKGDASHAELADCSPSAEHESIEPVKKDHAEPDDAAEAREYVKLNNQFVIPVMDAERVRALVVASLSVEISTGGAEQVYSREPKLRDAFLQVLFEHANIGGFEGRFTETARMEILR